MRSAFSVRAVQPAAVVAHLASTACRRSRPATICTWPPPVRGAMPCLIAFSTSGCRIIRGTSASSVVGIDVHADSQTILEARLFDLEILLQELELFLQRDLGLAAAVERDAQQIAQPADHPIGGLRIAVHQRRDRVQRVEQKVRMELRLERLQLRLDQPRLELRRLQLALLRLVVIRDRVADADDGARRPSGSSRDARRCCRWRYVQVRIHAGLPPPSPTAGSARRACRRSCTTEKTSAPAQCTAMRAQPSPGRRAGTGARPRRSLGMSSAGMYQSARFRMQQLARLDRHARL